MPAIAWAVLDMAGLELGVEGVEVHPASSLGTAEPVMAVAGESGGVNVNEDGPLVPKPTKEPNLDGGLAYCENVRTSALCSSQWRRVLLSLALVSRPLRGRIHSLRVSWEAHACWRIASEIVATAPPSTDGLAASVSLSATLIPRWPSSPPSSCDAFGEYEDNR